MDYQHHWVTESKIGSAEAVEGIKNLVADMRHSADVLDAAIAADRSHPNAHGLLELRMRRRNIKATVAILEDRLVSVEQLRSRASR